METLWQGRRIGIGICGGIATYKICSVVSSLAQRGAEIRVVLTAGAERFISPLTLATLSRHAAYTDADFWQPGSGRPLHIELAEWAEIWLVAPLSANTLAKIALGLADNLLTNVVLASSHPMLLAPAMNTQMWLAGPVQRNWQALQSDPRFWSIEPTSGRLACDTVGQGRMAEPEAIEEALAALLWTGGRRDWSNKSVLVSSGGTREPIDAVRFIGNPATGRMGSALALAAAHRGARVTLVHGTGSLRPDHSAIVSIEAATAADMHQQLRQHFPLADYTFMAAAVGDVRPRQAQTGKVPKSELPDSLQLERIPDILADLNQIRRPTQRLIGFAAQTGDPLPAALAKLQAKGIDAIVANPIDRPDGGFARPNNEAVWLGGSGDKRILPLCSKREMAHHLLDLAGEMG